MLAALKVGNWLINEKVGRPTSQYTNISTQACRITESELYNIISSGGSSAPLTNTSV
jgi:hypothetical protein